MADMAEPIDRKLYLGPRLRVLRRELGINQTRMAEELGVSPSYLNHLERNQRPFTGQMLLRLANTYDIDVRSFVVAGAEASVGDLAEMFADPLLRDLGTPRQEILEVAENYPNVAEAMTRIWRALTDLRRAPELIARLGSTPAVAGSPLEWVREHLQAKGNHFPELDRACEGIADALGTDPADVHAALRARLDASHRVSVRVVSARTLGGALRHYDVHRRRLMLSERLPAPSRLFALANQLATIECERLLTDAVQRAAAPDDQTRLLLRLTLANHAAAAIVMPYGRFRAAAEEGRYDLDLLEARFGASIEQVAHRLTTLGRTGERGVPFFMLKIDAAGIVSKRYAGEDFPFARFGGACPRWTIHRAFRVAGETVTQIVETPDGSRYATLSRAYPRPGMAGAESLVAIGLGCALRHAGRIAAFDEHDPARATTIGPTCHLCERVGCPDRALPPVTRSLALDPHQRPGAPYPFRAT